MKRRLTGVKFTFIKMKKAIICSTRMPSRSFFIAKETRVCRINEPIMKLCIVDSKDLPTYADAALNELDKSICCGIGNDGKKLVSNSGIILSVCPLTASL